MKAVPYYRVSTDDKGQDPSRQAALCDPWAQQNQVALTRPVIDEGTSASKTDPYQRPAFLQAIALAKLEKANAILVENIDRFSRKGSKMTGYYKVKLELEHKLKLWCADRSMEAQDSSSGELIESVQAFIGREKSEVLSRRVKEGMAKAKARGVHLGQPPKKLSQPEKDLASKMQEEGHGFGAIAAKINEARGVHLIATPEVRRRKSVSEATVRRAFKPRKPSEGSNPSEGPSLGVTG